MNILFCLILLCVGLLVSMKCGASLPRLYQSRRCEGRSWRNAFPKASKDEIRTFLLLFVSVFAFSDKDKLKFRPDDKILDIYRALYPSRWMPDGVEVETLARELRACYKLELNFIWSDELTLGEIFSNIKA